MIAGADGPTRERQENAPSGAFFRCGGWPRVAAAGILETKDADRSGERGMVEACDLLMLGSGPGLRALDALDTSGWTVLAINRAWQYRPERVDLVVHGDLLPGSARPPLPAFAGRVFSYADYRPIIDARAREWAEAHPADAAEAGADGPRWLSGHLIHFNASHWAMARLQPRRIAYLGCDFEYPPGDTHFYGRGQAVPPEEPGRASLSTYLGRLDWFAARDGVALFKLSAQGAGQLPYPTLSLPVISPALAEDGR